MHNILRDPGYYWVLFRWGWEKCEWTGLEWLRSGLAGNWGDEIVSVGERLEHG